MKDLHRDAATSMRGCVGLALVGLALVGLALGCVACDTYEVVPSIYKRAAPKPEVARPIPRPPPPPRPVVTPSSLSTAPEGPTPDEAPAEPERDLSAELRAAFGNPSGCLPPGSVEGGEGTLRLSVVITNAGRVTRATVAAPVDREVARCLQEQAEHVMLAAPIEEAPRSVAASIALVAPPAPTKQPAGRTLPPGTVHAAEVLPARGDGSRDTSFVEPVDTLPAIVPAERPEGFVAPQHTLPPRGETGSSRPVSGY